MPLVRTPYGLIYNTDGSLCATLLPEGGVAVTEGTENLVDNPTMLGETGIHSWFSAYYRSNSNIVYSIVDEAYISGTKSQRIQYTSATNDGGQLNSGIRFSLELIIGETYTFSFYGKNWEEIRPISWHPDNATTITQKKENLGDRWVRYEYTFKVDDNPVSVYIRPNGNRDYSFDVLMNAPQLEQKPFATPFVEGTRPAGRLLYDIPQLKGARDFTLHFKFLPYMFKEANWQQYLFSTRTDDYLHYYASINNSGTQLAINTALEEDNTWVYAHIDNPPININSWHRFVMTGRQEGDQATISIYLDGVEVYTSTRVGTLRPFPGILALGTNHSYSVSSVFNGAFRELYICPYAVSAETVATWHSLDAPFFDLREITTAELAAKEYAEAQAELARITAEAYADGRVTAEEQARIADAQQKLQEAKQYADQKAAEDIDASKRTIYAPGVIIDSTGAWGISGGVKQAGFGTDGRWVAGGGSVVADADGLIGKDPDTGEVKFKIGTNGKVEVLEIYSDMYKEIRNVLPYNYLDSLDADNPLICDFYIPSETENIVSVKLSAKGLPFRAYAKGSRSGGATVETSAFGGSHTHSLHNVELSTEGYHDHSGSTSTTGSHNHSISSSLTSTSKDNLSGVSSAIKRTSAEGTPGEPVGLHSHSIGDFDGASISGHTHDYYKADSTSSTGDHKHTISGDGRHTHTISSFSLVEGGSHTHKITIPGHTHDLIFGIYEDTSPANVVLWIDNGSGFNTSINLGSNEILAEELDITQYVTGTGWKRLKFTSSRLGRINAQLIVKVDLTA